MEGTGSFEYTRRVLRGLTDRARTLVDVVDGGGRSVVVVGAVGGMAMAGLDRAGRSAGGVGGVGGVDGAGERGDGAEKGENLGAGVRAILDKMAVE